MGFFDNNKKKNEIKELIYHKIDEVKRSGSLFRLTLLLQQTLGASYDVAPEQMSPQFLSTATNLTPRQLWDVIFEVIEDSELAPQSNSDSHILIQAVANVLAQQDNYTDRARNSHKLPAKFKNKAGRWDDIIQRIRDLGDIQRKTLNRTERVKLVNETVTAIRNEIKSRLVQHHKIPTAVPAKDPDHEHKEIKHISAEMDTKLKTSVQEDMTENKTEPVMVEAQPIQMDEYHRLLANATEQMNQFLSNIDQIIKKSKSLDNAAAQTLLQASIRTYNDIVTIDKEIEHIRSEYASRGETLATPEHFSTLRKKFAGAGKMIDQENKARKLEASLDNVPTNDPVRSHDRRDKEPDPNGQSGEKAEQGRSLEPALG